MGRKLVKVLYLLLFLLFGMNPYLGVVILHFRNEFPEIQVGENSLSIELAL